VLLNTQGKDKTMFFKTTMEVLNSYS